MVSFKTHRALAIFVAILLNYKVILYCCSAFGTFQQIQPVWHFF